jgi:hypothetical protein
LSSNKNRFYISSDSEEENSSVKHNEKRVAFKKSDKGERNVAKKLSFSDKNEVKVYEVEVDIYGRVPRLRRFSTYSSDVQEEVTHYKAALLKEEKKDKVVEKKDKVVEKKEKLEKRKFNIRTDSWNSFEFSDSDDE